MNDFKSMKKPKNVIILGFFKYVLIEQHRQVVCIWYTLPENNTRDIIITVNSDF